MPYPRWVDGDELEVLRHLPGEDESVAGDVELVDERVAGRVEEPRLDLREVVELDPVLPVRAEQAYALREVDAGPRQGGVAGLDHVRPLRAGRPNWPGLYGAGASIAGHRPMRVLRSS